MGKKKSIFCRPWQKILPSHEFAKLVFYPNERKVGGHYTFGRLTVILSQIKIFSSFWASRIMGSAYANEQDGLEVSRACSFTGH